MAARPRLTKSLYVLGLECPAKIHYQRHPEAYANSRSDDAFLRELAKGGFQVGALAKAYHPEGIDLDGLPTEEALERTREELSSKDQVTLFEAAVEHEGLLARIDILRKRGDRIELIEVKAKSFDPLDRSGFFTQKEPRRLYAEWVPYLHDVAFQSYVLSRAYPRLEVEPFLCLANKGRAATVDGINQKFKVSAGPRPRVTTPPGLKKEDLGEPLLQVLPVREAVSFIHSTNNHRGRPFAEEAADWARAVSEDRKPAPKPGSACRDCEFREVSAEAARDGRRSGFAECWAGTSEDPSTAMVFDVWNFRGTEGALARGRALLTQLEESDFGAQDPAPEGGLSAPQRQWLQVRKARDGDREEFVDRAGLARAMAAWKYPLHFIDFETSSVALPFHAGRKPYETIAFQFSHHVLKEDGRLEHRGQWLCDEPGRFPNFEFVRALRKELEGDEGTIFRYASHENTVLLQIFGQLYWTPPDVTDRDDLQRFIKWITHSPARASSPWRGERDMVDLRELVLRHYYHPAMGGSNSLKAVLPAVLGDSRALREKYGRPAYGKGLEIPSLNFEKMQWVRAEADGKVEDPYRLLPPVFDRHTRDELDRLVESDELADGGAAMCAYAKLQFPEMSEAERAQVREALLKYCELDTLAMAMLVEHWRSLCPS